MNVADIMSQPVISVTPNTSIADLVALLDERRISGVPVVDDAGALVGVISITDLLSLSIGDAGEAENAADFHTSPAMDGMSDLNGLIRPDDDALGREVGELMSTHIITATEDAPVSEIAETMVTRRVHRIIITRDEKAIGIVSVGDILRALSRGALKSA